MIQQQTANWRHIRAIEIVYAKFSAGPSVWGTRENDCSCMGITPKRYRGRISKCLTRMRMGIYGMTPGYFTNRSRSDDWQVDPSPVLGAWRMSAIVCASESFL